MESVHAGVKNTVQVGDEKLGGNSDIKVNNGTFRVCAILPKLRSYITLWLEIIVAPENQLKAETEQILGHLRIQEVDFVQCLLWLARMRHQVSEKNVPVLIDNDIFSASKWW